MLGELDVPEPQPLKASAINMADDIYLEPGTADIGLGEAQEIFEQARTITGQIRGSMAELEHILVRAYNGRAWLVMGYESWDECVADQLQDARIWKNVEDRHERVANFKNFGLSSRAIGAILGVSHITVQRDLGLLTGTNVPVNTGPEQGLDSKFRPVIRSMPAEVLDKRIQVIALTDQKVPQEEIAQRLGISQGRVSQLKAEFRESMANLPDEDQEKLVELFETGQTPTVEAVAEALGVTLAGPTSVEESALRSIVALVDEVRQAVKALHDHGIYGAYGDQLQSDLTLNRDVSLAVSLKLTTAIAVLARCARALRVDRTGVDNIMATITESANAIQVLDGWHEQVQAHTRPSQVIRYGNQG